MNLDSKNESAAVWVICTYTYIQLDTIVCVFVCVQNMADVC